MDRIESKSALSTGGGRVILAILTALLALVVFSNSLVGAMARANLVAVLGTVAIAFVAAQQLTRMLNISVNETFRVRRLEKPKQPEQKQQNPQRDNRLQQDNRRDDRRDNRPQHQRSGQPQAN